MRSEVYFTEINLLLNFVEVVNDIALTEDKPPPISLEKLQGH